MHIPAVFLLLLALCACKDHTAADFILAHALYKPVNSSDTQ